MHVLGCVDSTSIARIAKPPSICMPPKTDWRALAQGKSCHVSAEVQKATANRCATYCLCTLASFSRLTGQFDISRVCHAGHPTCSSIARITIGACPYPYHSRSSPMATCRKDLARPSSWTISRAAPLFLSNEAESSFSTFAPSLVPITAKCCFGPSYDRPQLCLSRLRLTCVHETYSIAILQRRWRREDVLTSWRSLSEASTSEKMSLRLVCNLA
jgi:hypothetical protein